MLTPPARWIAGATIAREFFEHDVLVLGLGAELGRLEQTFAVPFVVGDSGSGERRGDERDGQIDARQHPVGGEGDVAVVEVVLDRRLDLREQAVVLGVEQLLDGGQSEVLVHPAVAGDIVLSSSLLS